MMVHPGSLPPNIEQPVKPSGSDGIPQRAGALDQYFDDRAGPKRQHASKLSCL